MRAWSARRRRGPGRAHAWSSSAVVLGLFAWFALTACFFESKDDPATTGRDTVYGDTTVHHGPDGGTVYGDFHCDRNNRYLGGGDAASVANTRRNLEAAIARLEREIEDVDRQRDQCKGRTRPATAYVPARICNNLALAAANVEEKKRREAFMRAQAASRTADSRHVQVRSAWMRRMGEIGGEAARTDPYLANLADQMEKRRTEALQAAQTELRAEEAWRNAEEAQQREHDCLDRVAADQKADPCSDLNYLPIAQRWNQLRNQLAMYERDLDRLKDCDENRAAQAGGRPTQPGGRPSQPGAMGLGEWVIQEFLLNAPIRRPPPTHPHGSPPP